MFKNNKHSMSRYFTVISALLLGAGGYISSASAADYSVVAGSQVLLATLNTELIPGNTNNILFITGNNDMASLPLLGGFSKTSGNCVSPFEITAIDVWKRIRINSAGIIAGFTGRLSGGVVTVKKYDEQTVSETYSGGITGNRNNGLRSPNNEEWGNKLATAEGYLWIYVAKDIPLGTYPLNGLFLSQGPGYDNYASIGITQAGDTLTVRPPPCTIATETSINFDTYSPEGRKVSVPITYQCGEIDSTTVLDAYLIATAIGSPASATELALTSNGGNPGGRVRGYVGEGVDTDNVNCLDSANSLSFDGAFNTRFAPVSNGLTLQVPLVWQLCTQGNEVPGLATGSVLLDIGYK